MRYILDDEGYILDVSLEANISCESKTCEEYKGEIPYGYESIDEWLLNANIRAYKIVEGNLVFDSTKDAELRLKWELEKGLSDNVVNIITEYASIQGGVSSVIPTNKNSLITIDVSFYKTFNSIPIVTITPTNEVGYFYVSNKTKEGFNINFYSNNKEEINFNWLAVGKN